MTTKTKAGKGYKDTGFGGNALKGAAGPGMLADAGRSESDMAARTVMNCCSSLAERLDWQFYMSASEDKGPVQMIVGESDHALRSGRYIKVKVLPEMGTVWFTGGYYDIYYCPITVFDRSIRLNDLSSNCLEEVLSDVYDRLEGLSISYGNRHLR